MLDIYFSHIVAAARNGSIGYRGRLPWHLPEDLRYFAKKTKGHIVIMGRKTWESFEGLLPQRLHIVITRQSEYQASSEVRLCQSLEGAMSLARQIILQPPLGARDDEVESVRVTPRANESNKPIDSVSHGNLQPPLGAWPEEVFILGGGQIYEQSLSQVRRVYLTRIDQDFKGDAFYPVLGVKQFQLISRTSRPGPPPFAFELYQRSSTV